MLLKLPLKKKIAEVEEVDTSINVALSDPGPEGKATLEENSVDSDLEAQYAAELKNLGVPESETGTMAVVESELEDSSGQKEIDRLKSVVEPSLLKKMDELFRARYIHVQKVDRKKLKKD